MVQSTLLASQVTNPSHDWFRTHCFPTRFQTEESMSAFFQMALEITSEAATDELSRLEHALVIKIMGMVKQFTGSERSWEHAMHWLIKSMQVCMATSPMYRYDHDGTCY